MTAIGALVLHPRSLTVIRFVVPMLTLDSVWRLTFQEVEWRNIAAAALLVTVCVIVFNAGYGTVHAQSAAYGHERRYLLRPPVAVILPLVVLWLLVATAAAVAMYAGSTVTAAIACVPLTAVGSFALHRASILARRWIVFVPAGIALHDPLVLRDTFMVRAIDVRALRPAAMPTEAFDATCTTWGTSLELVVSHPRDVSLSQFGARITRTLDRLHVTALLVSPSQPQRVLDGQRATPPPSTSRSSES
jgi:hypothetical protein